MNDSRWRYGLVLAGLVLVVGLVWVAIVALRPFPERSFTMATGPEGSAYAAFGERYRAILAEHGVELTLVPTNGSSDNIARLRDPRSGVSAAFVQAGTTSVAESPGLVSLGTLFREPLWVFCRCNPSGLDLRALLGEHVSIGPAGSATRELTLRLLKLNGIEPGQVRLEGYAPEQAAKALLGGQINAAIIDTAWDSPVVRRLLADRSIGLAGFPRADAYVALLPYLGKVVLPMGVANLAENRPPQDTVLIAPKASLVVRGDLHPALQYLLIDAAMKIHGGPGVFHGEGEFPAPEMIDLPLSDEALHMYRSGPGFLRRHLPFWLAEFVQRLLILVIPLVGIVYPLTTFAPTAWRWQMERRVHRIYRELLSLDMELRRMPAGAPRDELLTRLDDLEGRAARLRLPDSFAAMSYELKQNIRFVQKRCRV
jgi:TRAP-type uncharacterized transport system substrate-binding protein